MSGDSGASALAPSRWQRWLLPGGLTENAEAGRSQREWVIDALAFLAAVAFGAAVLADTWDQHSRAGAVADVAIGTVACLSLWWRRRHPVAVATLAIAGGSVSALSGLTPVIAIFTVAVRASGRALAALTALSLVSVSIWPAVLPDPDVSYLGQIGTGALVTFVAVGWGLFARARRELVVSLSQRAQSAEADRVRHAERARDAERHRIAREMHDVLAHRLSLLALHAGALEFRPDASRDEIVHATETIRASAAAAQRELREVIGVLRDEEEPDAPEPPQPTLADVPALIEERRAAHMTVNSRIEMPRSDQVPDGLGRTAYRIVQEGLTNAGRHAPGATVDVWLREEDAELLVEVASRPAVAAGDPGNGSGTGLIGLRERVVLAGGELTHGRERNGDFVLRARLPRTS